VTVTPKSTIAPALVSYATNDYDHSALISDDTTTHFDFSAPLSYETDFGFSVSVSDDTTHSPGSQAPVSESKTTFSFATDYYDYPDPVPNVSFADYYYYSPVSEKTSSAYGRSASSSFSESKTPVPISEMRATITNSSDSIFDVTITSSDSPAHRSILQTTNTSSVNAVGRLFGLRCVRFYFLLHLMFYIQSVSHIWAS